MTQPSRFRFLQASLEILSNIPVGRIGNDGVARTTAWLMLEYLRNPDIAHVLYLQGMMEKLGRGGMLISRAFAEQGLPPPEWQSDAHGVTLTLRTPEVLRLIHVLQDDSSRKELQQALTLKDDEHFRKRYLRPALAAGVVEMTLPTKPTSSKQRYRLTPLGRNLHDRQS